MRPAGMTTGACTPVAGAATPPPAATTPPAAPACDPAKFEYADAGQCVCMAGYMRPAGMTTGACTPVAGAATPPPAATTPPAPACDPVKFEYADAGQCVCMPGYSRPAGM